MKAKPSEDALAIKDMVSQVKDTELKSQARDSQSEKADPKKDPPTGEGLKNRVFLCSFLCTYVPFFFFCNGLWPQFVRDLLLINE